MATQADGGSGSGGANGFQGPQGPTGPSAVNEDSETIRIGLGAGLVNQGQQGVAIGFDAGESNQGTGCIAVGALAGKSDQTLYTTAIGYQAGQVNQGSVSVALGPLAGTIDQGQGGVAIGAAAAEETQGIASIAIGNAAGRYNQGDVAVAIGQLAGSTAQGLGSVAVGFSAGFVQQSESSVGVGYAAAREGQARGSVAIGAFAGRSEQSTNSVAVGQEAGYETQGQGSVAIGRSAGRVNQGNYCVAVGHRAGRDNQPPNSICFNAMENPLVPGGAGLYVKPVTQLPTQEQGGNYIPMLYRPESGEIINSGIDFTQSTRLRVGYIDAVGIQGAQGVSGEPSTNNRGVDIGATPAVANTAYIDFNSLDNGTNDFDGRILCIGGVSGTNGQAIMQFQGSEYIITGVSSSLKVDNEYAWRNAGTTNLPSGGVLPLRREFNSSMRTYCMALAGATAAGMDFVYPNGRPMFGHYWFSADCPNDATPGSYNYVTWELYLYRSGGTAGCKWEEVYVRRQTQPSNNDVNIIIPSNTSPGVVFQTLVNRPSKYFVQVTLIDY